MKKEEENRILDEDEKYIKIFILDFKYFRNFKNMK